MSRATRQCSREALWPDVKPVRDHLSSAQRRAVLLTGRAAARPVSSSGLFGGIRVAASYVILLNPDAESSPWSKLATSSITPAR